MTTPPAGVCRYWEVVTSSRVWLPGVCLDGRDAPLRPRPTAAPPPPRRPPGAPRHHRLMVSQAPPIVDRAVCSTGWSLFKATPKKTGLWPRESVFGTGSATVQCGRPPVPAVAGGHGPLRAASADRQGLRSGLRYTHQRVEAAVVVEAAATAAVGPSSGISFWIGDPLAGL